MSNLCISSLVVHARPAMLTSVRQWIDTIPEAEVYSNHADDRLVVVLDTYDNRQAADKISDIQNQGDVLSTTLIYQYNDRPGAQTGLTA